MKPVVKNAASKSQVKESDHKIRRGREREVADICHVLSSVEGRRFVWRYLETCKVFQSSWDHSGSVMSFNEGQRNVGLRLLADINEAMPEAYLVMMKESKES
jgi:hypothetical protein